MASGCVAATIISLRGLVEVNKADTICLSRKSCDENSFQQAGKDFYRRARSFVILSKTPAKFIANVLVITMGRDHGVPNEKWKELPATNQHQACHESMNVIGGCGEISAVLVRNTLIHKVL